MKKSERKISKTAATITLSAVLAVGTLCTTALPVCYDTAYATPYITTLSNKTSVLNITVNGTKLKRQGYYATSTKSKNEKVAMIPLRATANAMGITITKNEDGTYKLDNGTMNTTITIGEDSYYALTSIKGREGMTAPFTLGAAPVVKKHKIYIPATLLTPLYGNADKVVTIKKNTITIDTTKGDSSKGSNDKSNIPCPITEWTSLSDLEKAVGFTVVIPEKLSTLNAKTYADISGDLAEIFYTNGSDEMLYRMSKGKEDNSGDYNEYNTTEKVVVGGNSITICGNDGLYYLAKWSDDSYSYSLNMGQTGVTKTEMLTYLTFED